jgi:ATP-dependent Lon protease
MKKLFGDVLPGARSIIIHDSYIEKDHQLENLIKFCSMAKKICSPEKIKLITKQCNKIKIDEKLKEFKQNLKKHKIEFEVEYSPTIHDRRIELDNGWTIIPGLGLDIYKHPGKWFSLEAADDFFRACKQTNIDFIFKGNSQAEETATGASG